MLQKCAVLAWIAMLKGQFRLIARGLTVAATPHSEAAWIRGTRFLSARLLLT